jgi:hypothetical protein
MKKKNKKLTITKKTQLHPKKTMMSQKNRLFIINNFIRKIRKIILNRNKMNNKKRNKNNIQKKIVYSKTISL